MEHRQSRAEDEDQREKEVYPTPEDGVRKSEAEVGVPVDIHTEAAVRTPRTEDVDDARRNLQNRPQNQDARSCSKRKAGPKKQKPKE